MKKREIVKGFFVATGLFCLVSAAILMMAFNRTLSRELWRGWSITAGLLFWIGIAGGSIAYFLLCKKAKETIRRQMPEKRKLPGGLCFFSNPPAKVADCILIISLIVNVICMIKTSVAAVGWCALFFFVTSLYMHFLLNGRIFHYIMNSNSTQYEERKKQ